MYFRRSLVWILPSILLVSGTLRSQGDRPGQVTTVFSVTDKKGMPVTGLQAASVRIREDGMDQAVVRIRDISSEPVSITLLVDVSGSTVDQPRYWRSEAINFLTSTIRTGIDKAEIIHFHQVVFVSQGLTDNIASLTSAIQQNVAAGGTSVYDALTVAAGDLGKTPGRRAIVLISDGEDNTSATSGETAMERIRESGAVGYALTLKNGSLLPRDRPSFLTKLAEETGGGVFSLADTREARNAFMEIRDQLRSQYSVEYQPKNKKADGKFRKLRIEVLDKSLRVKHASGYYAKP